MLRCSLISAWIVMLGSVIAAPAQVKLEQKFPDGRKSEMHLSTINEQLLVLNRMNIETKIDQFIVMEWRNGERGPDGTLPVEVEVKTIQSTLDLPGGVTLTFDSGNPDQKADNPDLDKVLDLFRATMNSTTRMELDAHNDVKSLEFVGDPASDLDDAFKSQFDADYHKKTTQQELDLIPDKPVKPGDTWRHDSELDLASGQTMAFQTEYTYAGTVDKEGQTLDRITGKLVEVTYSIDPTGGLPLQLVKSDLKPAESEIEILFDRERGETVSTVQDMRITGDLTFKVNDQELAGSLDLKMKNTIEVQP